MMASSHDLAHFCHVIRLETAWTLSWYSSRVGYQHPKSLLSGLQPGIGAPPAQAAPLLGSYCSEDIPGFSASLFQVHANGHRED